MDPIPENRMMSMAEVFERWLAWPGNPFGWEQCDTPIEDGFFHHLYKFANDQVALRRQHEIDTDAGTFRLDFLLTHRTTGRPIGIECDGRDFHSVARDCKRDEAIIRTGHVAEIYRIAGKDLHYNGADTLHLLSAKEPWLVRQRFFDLVDRICTRPELYEDESVVALEGGYRGIRRTYFEFLEDEDDPNAGSEWDEERDCPRERERVECRKRTPTLIRYMSAPGHPSAFAHPEHLIPLPMPEWKIELAKLYHARDKSTNG